MTTELQAVNQMLSGIGEAPVNSLEGSLTTDVAMARNILQEVSEEVQGRAWYFNTDEDVTLTPDASGEIGLSASIIRIDGLPGIETVQLIKRGARLYNRTKHNFIFDNPVRVNKTTLLVWDEVPPVPQRYVVVRASRILNDRSVGDFNAHQFSLRDEVFALADLKQWDDEHAGYNVLELNSSIFQTLNRGIRGGRRRSF